MVFRPFLQEGPFDYQGYLLRRDAFGNAEVNGDVEAVRGQGRAAGLVDVPFVLAAGVLTQGRDEISRVLVVIELGSEVRPSVGVECVYQCAPGTLPCICRSGQLAEWG